MLNVNFETAKDGVYFSIDVNEQFAGVQVESISMFVGTKHQDDCGDLAVTWSMDGLVNNEEARTAGALLLRNVNSDDDVTTVMGEFYWQRGFDERLREILVQHGFSAEAAAHVCGSEWGMQDEGRASYDAYEIADEVRKHLKVAVAA